jgi:hypothetical protein
LSKNATNNYGLLANILGVNKYDDLTGISTYTIPHEPASYDPNITDATPTHTRMQMEEEWVLDLRNPKAYYWRENQGIPTISGLSLSKY